MCVCVCVAVSMHACMRACVHAYEVTLSFQLGKQFVQNSHLSRVFHNVVVRCIGRTWEKAGKLAGVWEV